MKLLAPIALVSLLAGVAGCPSPAPLPATGDSPPAAVPLTAESPPAVPTATASSAPTSGPVVATPGSGAQTPGGATTVPCVPGDDAASWNACTGQRVRIRGKASLHVSQHPMHADPRPGAAPPRKQTYLDAPGGRQIVLLVTKDIQCPGAMIVTGTLNGVALGGTVGKETYSGWSIPDADVQCE